MKNATHRVIILKNCNSDLISQAIFFLKDTCSETEAGIIAEAEKIVEKYMSTGQLHTESSIKKMPNRGNLIRIISAAAILLVTAATLFVMLK